MTRILCIGNTAALETWLAGEGANIVSTTPGLAQTEFRVTGISDASVKAYCVAHPEVSFISATPNPQVNTGKTAAQAAQELRAERAAKRAKVGP